MIISIWDRIKENEREIEACTVKNETNHYLIDDENKDGKAILDHWQGSEIENDRGKKNRRL